MCIRDRLIGGVISIPLINNHTAYKVEKKLCETPLPEKTELIESISRAGKLTGNGNGMQYFGAILIRSDLSLEELDASYVPVEQKIVLWMNLLWKIRKMYLPRRR